jgi:hypothetical protein
MLDSANMIDQSDGVVRHSDGVAERVYDQMSGHRDLVLGIRHS